MKKYWIERILRKYSVIEDEVGNKTIQTEINLDIGSSQKYGLHNEHEVLDIVVPNLHKLKTKPEKSIIVQFINGSHELSRISR
jgi:hypothetical protein